MIRILKSCLFKSLLLLPGFLLLGFLGLAFFRVPIAEKIVVRQFAEAGVTVDISITDWHWGYFVIEKLSLETEEWSVNIKDLTLTHDARLFTARKLNSLTAEKVIVHLPDQLAEPRQNDSSTPDLMEFLKGDFFFQSWPVTDISVAHIQVLHSTDKIFQTPIEASVFSTVARGERYLQVHLDHGPMCARLTATRGEKKWWAEISTGIPPLKLNSQELSLGNWEIPSPSLFFPLSETFPTFSLVSDRIDLQAEFVWFRGQKPHGRINATTNHLNVSDDSWDSRIHINGFLAEVHDPLTLLSPPEKTEDWKGMVHLDELKLTTSFAEINLQGVSAMADQKFHLYKHWGRLAVRSGVWDVNLPLVKEFLANRENKGTGEIKGSTDPLLILTSLLFEYPLEFALRNQSVIFQDMETLPDLIFHSERHQDPSGHFPLAFRIVHTETLEQLDMLLAKSRDRSADLRARMEMEIDGFGLVALSELLPFQSQNFIPEEGSIKGKLKATWAGEGNPEGQWEKTLTGKNFSGNWSEHDLFWKLEGFILSSEGEIPEVGPETWRSLLPQTGSVDLSDISLEHSWFSFFMPVMTISAKKSASRTIDYTADILFKEPFIEIDVNNWRDFMPALPAETQGSESFENSFETGSPLLPIPEIPFVGEITLRGEDGETKFTHWYNSRISLPWEAEGKAGNDKIFLKVSSGNEISSVSLEYNFTTPKEEFLHIEGEIQEHEISTFWKNIIEDLLGIEASATLGEFVFAGSLRSPKAVGSSELGIILNFIDFAIPKWDVAGEDLSFSALWSNIWKGEMERIGKEEDSVSLPLALTFEKLHIADLPFSDGKVLGIMESWDSLSVKEATTSWRTAKLNMSPFSLNPFSPEGIFRFNFQAVPIRELLALFPQLHTTGEGNLEGSVSFFASPSKFRILPGTLALPEGEKASLQIRYPGLFTGSLSPRHPRYELLRRAESGLENLVVEQFLVQLFRPEEPETPIKLSIRTQALGEDILPFDLNFHIHGAVAEILPLLLRSDLKFSF
ncbi:MAG: hypothetical protein JJT75_09685 [Opitutales bacterium]|nr:hypothetical protein [Opitutales bacterium]MCH8540547.1 hypothetical protein [Opitutales bacterium]